MSRARVIGMVLAAVLTLAVGVVPAATAEATCSRFDMGRRTAVEEPCPPPVRGPGGQAVEDRFAFVHRPLRGDGGITVRVSSLTGRIKQPPPPGTGAGPPPVPGLVPWAKAGVMVKDGVRQGSRYAAVMVTARHGVRMQYDFTEDIAGSAGGGPADGSPRWLRLVRSGDTVIGSESADGKRWTVVGRVRLGGLPETVEIGLFVASPGALTMGAAGPESRFSDATAVFDQVSPRDGAWRFDDIGVDFELDGVTPHHPGAFTRSGERFIVTGVGDIGPSVDGLPIERTLIGGFAGLILVIVVAAAFGTAGPGAAAPGSAGRWRTRGRGAELAARSAVVGTVAFLAGAVPAAIVVPVGLTLLPGGGVHPLPAGLPAYLRLIAGTGLLFAVVAIGSLALGVLIGRGAVAALAAVTVLFPPYVLALAGAGEWLLAWTPAAGFAIQQTVREYAHVAYPYLPISGFFPLPPWAGFGVLCAWAVLALWAAARRGRASTTA